MGRPTNPRNIGNAIGSIRVTNYRFVAGAPAESGAPAFIVAMKGTNKIRVNDGTTTENLRLVNVNAGALVAGECRISGVLDNSTIVNITKIRNRSIQHSGTTNIQVEGNVDGGKIGSGLEPSDATDLKISIDVLSATV